MTVRWSLSVLPASQAIQPGRLTTTSIVSFSPAGIRFSGQILSSRTLTGTSDWLRPPTTETRSIVPPPSGIPTLAIALESVGQARVGGGEHERGRPGERQDEQQHAAGDPAPTVRPPA